jgi:amidase
VCWLGTQIQLNTWFANLKANPSGVRTLEQLIEFNDAHPDLEEPVGYQNDSNLVFILSQNTTGRNQTYFDALKTSTRLGGEDGIDAALRMHNLDALVLPSPGLTPHLAALSGYPIVTVPLGFYPDNVTTVSTGPGTFYPAPGLPFGLSFIAGKFSDFQLIGFAYAFEQATHTRLRKKAYPDAIPKTQLKDLVPK